jgi:parallel beta helix pectate lyase-like protein
VPDHLAAVAGLHRQQFRASRVRRGALLTAGVVIALALGLGAYFWTVREGPPDVAAAPDGYWVSTHGDDTASGSPGHPWRTVGHAIAAAPAAARVYLRAGDYPPFTVDRAGMIIAGAPGEHPTITGRAGVRDVVLVTADNVTLTDLGVSGCVPKANPNTDITGDHGSGIRVDGTTGVVIRGVHVHDSHGVNAAGLPVGCYGILATRARKLSVSGSEVDHNGAGIVVSRGGQGVTVEGNKVHDQDVIVQNSTAADDDFGGYGLAATFITDKPGPTFSDNTVEHNIGTSTDYGVDGGGFEIYDTTNTTITRNTFIDNNGVLETGTGSDGQCAGNVFSGNTAASRGHTAQRDHFTGMVLRCGAGMVITDNAFENLSNFTFVVSSDDRFAGVIAGLTITGNTVTQRAGSVVFRLQYAASAARPAMTVDDNRYRLAGDGFAVVGPTTSDAAVDAANTVDFGGWRSGTGLDASSSAS